MATEPVAPPPVPAISTPAPLPAVSKPTESSGGSGGKALASPAVRRRAREAGVDLASVRGSGPAGRIRHADLDAFIAAGGMVQGAAPVAYTTRRSDVEEIKVVGLRRKIAEAMTISKLFHISLTLRKLMLQNWRSYGNSLTQPNLLNNRN